MHKQRFKQCPFEPKFGSNSTVLKTSVELRSTKPQNLFWNIAIKRVEKLWCAFYQPSSNLSWIKSGCCKLREYFLKLDNAVYRSYVTRCKTILPWACKNPQHVQITLQKIELLCTFYNYFSRPTSTRSVATQVWCMVVKRATSLFNSSCSNFTRFCCSF